MDPLREIEEVVAFGARGAGTNAERRVANHLAERLRALGREVRVEPISVLPGWPVAHALLALAGVAGSVLSVDAPIAGAAIVLAATVAALADLTGASRLVRRIGGQRASQNVVSTEDGDKPGVLVLVAHHDAGRTGAVFGRRALARRARIGRILRRPIGLFEPYFWSLVVVAVCCVLRIVGIEALALTIVQFIPTVVLIVTIPLFADIALSGVVPGANDNASGLATVLRLAERHGGALEHFDLWVILPGAHEGGFLGMSRWLRANRRSLDPARTIFLEVDEVGDGAVRYVTKEGLVVGAAYHPTLVELCDELGDDEVRPLASRGAGDAHAARLRGFPAIRVTCRDALGLAAHHHQPTDVPEHVDPDALEDAFLFCSELIELIDARIGPELGSDPRTPGQATAPDAG